MRKRRRSRSKPFHLFGIVLYLMRGIFFLFRKSLPFAAAGGLFYFSFFGVRSLLQADPYFHVSSIHVFPKGLLTSRQTHQIEKWCSKTNLLDLDIRRIAGLIQSDPRIKRASVTRKLPDELEIVLTPRKPLAQLRVMPHGPYYALDNTGIVMAVNAIKQAHLMTLTDYTYPRKRFSLFDHYSKSSLKKSKQILKALKENEITQNEVIDKIAIGHLGNFSVFLLNGPELRIGEDSGNLQKINAVAELLQENRRQKITYIDLRYRNVIVK